MAWPEDDWRYGHPDWTYVVDASGGRFVKRAPRKRRRAPRALRFGDLQAGAVLICRRFAYQMTAARPGTANENQQVIPCHFFAVVTDRWFDPVAGQTDRIAGEMAALRHVNGNGLVGCKQPHTLRGLAMQGFNYATPEQAEAVSAFVAERVALTMEYEAGSINSAEARVRATPYRLITRLLEGSGGQA